MGPDGGGGGGGGGGTVESCECSPKLAMVGPDAHQSSVQSQYRITERCHGIDNFSQLVDSSVLRVHISMI